jgi:DNA polymerase-3 subunit epsilon
MPATSEEFAAAAQLLDSSPDYKVLRRFVPDPWRYVNRSSSDGEALKTGIFLDVEATGLDVRKDRITQLALVPFQYDALGFIVDAGEGVSYFNDPGRPIPPEVVELTGITDDMVRGQSIDVPAVEALIGQAGIVIAHHAEYDRQMVERAVPKFAEVFWGCSYREVEWVKRFGCRAAKLSIARQSTIRIWARGAPFEVKGRPEGSRL